MKSDSMKGGRAAKSTGSGAPANAERVKAVQQALKDKGHDPGDVDGKMGPRTQAALRDFQQKEGLKASGNLDSETMAKLGVDMKTSASGASTSPSASPSTGGASSSGASSGSSDMKSGSESKATTPGGDASGAKAKTK